MTEARTIRVGQTLCLVGASLGLMGLVGWFAGISRLTTVIEGQAPMMPNTALGLVLVGAAGFIRGRSVAGRTSISLANSAAAFVTAGGILTFIQYLAGVDFGIDEFVLTTGGSEPYPGRPSPPTAFALALIGSAVFCLDLRPRALIRPSEWLLAASAFIAYTAILSQLFGAPMLYWPARAPVIGVAVPTSVALALISGGILLERPAVGFMRIVMSAGPGGRMFRRLAVAALVAPISYGVVISRVLPSQGFGVADYPLVAATLSAVATLVGIGLLNIIAVSLERTHRELEASRGQCETLVDQASDGIFIADLNGRYTGVNEVGCRMVGYSREEILGKTVLSMIPAVDRRRLVESRKQMLDGNVHVDRWRIRRKDGTFLPVEVSAKVLPDGRWQGIVRDISRQNRYERELKFLAEAGVELARTLEYEETLSRIAELAVRDFAEFCIIDIVDADGTIRRLRVTARDPLDEPLCERLLKFPLDRSAPHLMRETLTTGRSVLKDLVPTGELEALSQGNDHFAALRALHPRSLITVPLSARDRLLGVIGFIAALPGKTFDTRDLTLAEELAARASLSIENAGLYRTARGAIAARESVLGIVAHDLRNPLAAIILQASQCGRREGEERRSRASWDRIVRAARRMDRIIQDLLDVSRMEAGEFAVEKRLVSVDEIVASAVDSQGALVAHASLTLEVEPHPPLPDFYGDPERLLQVFENLIGNSVKFTRSGGRIVIRAALSDGQILFSVSDTGEGIAPEQIPHLFEPFWQMTKERRRGAGLGLFIVKKIIDAHNGTIRVDSRVGGGSTFHFTVPAVVAEDGGPVASSGPWVLRA